MMKKINKKYRKNIVSLIVLGFGCTFLWNAKPVAAMENSRLVLKETVGQVQPFVEDIIVKKYRVYNGRHQYRRWNETKQKWVDPYWIDM